MLQRIHHGGLFQKFDAVNIGRGGTPLTRGVGIDAPTDPRDQGHVRFVKIGLKRGAQVELRRHRFIRLRMADTHKPAALVKKFPLIGRVEFFLLPQEEADKIRPSRDEYMPTGDVVLTEEDVDH